MKIYFLLAFTLISAVVNAENLISVGKYQAVNETVYLDKDSITQLQKNEYVLIQKTSNDMNVYNIWKYNLNDRTSCWQGWFNHSLSQSEIKTLQSQLICYPKPIKPNTINSNVEEFLANYNHL